MEVANVIRANHRTINYFKGRYGKQIEPDEISQVCRLAIVDGIGKWDQGRGNFQSFIYYKMNGSLRNKIKGMSCLKALDTVSIDTEEFNPVHLSIRPKQEDTRQYKEYLYLLVTRLNRKERNVLKFLTHGYNGAEIGNEMGLTRERVRQIRGNIGIKFMSILKHERNQLDKV